MNAPKLSEVGCLYHPEPTLADLAWNRQYAGADCLQPVWRNAHALLERHDWRDRKSDDRATQP